MPLRKLERCERRRGAGKAQKNRRMQGEHDYERLAEREQAEPVDVAAEDAKRDDPLRAEIGTVFRAYGNRRPQLLPAMETRSPCRSISGVWDRGHCSGRGAGGKHSLFALTARLNRALSSC